jgi:acyl-CoA thioester hydrolase
MSGSVVWREPVREEWIAHVGLGPEHRARESASLYTVEAHVRYLDQVSAGADLEVRSSVIGASDKLMRVWHELWVDGTVRATEEVLGLHVDTRTGRSAPFPPAVVALVRAAIVPEPPDAGRAISL